ncbi:MULTISPECIES: sigma-70 RNA polymerase sigma factor region 4 domain-containing protein [Bacillus]|uniref:sigma-70 family RNA polymerase sigma factor n=1 Tax=Bacillus cereus TaxID=1396 RepID=UPI0020CD31B9|nr:sigma-70 family RNA polymerase sigma factor [Bacillus cereus]
MEEEIEYLEYKLKRTNSQLQRQISIDSSEDKITTDSDNAELEESIKQVEQELFLKKQSQKKIVALIGKFERLENQILTMKHIDGMTLDAIADELHYHPNHIKNKHAEIMRRIRFADVGISV